MATKKSADQEEAKDPRGAFSAIEERRKRREEATTVDGSEEVGSTDAPAGKNAEDE